MTLDPTWTLGSFAIIRNSEGEVLLSHRPDLDLWTLPGGGVEAGELPTEAVIREVLEETGLVARVSRLAGVYGKPGQQELVFAFECAIVGGELSATSEADEHRWFAPAALPRNFPPRQKERLDDLNARETVVKWHRADSWSR